MPARGRWPLLGLVCLLAAVPAAAETLYRCDRPDGGRSYGNRRVPGARCAEGNVYQGRRPLVPPSVQLASGGQAPRARVVAPAAAPPGPAEGAMADPAGAVSNAGGDASAPAVRTPMRVAQGEIYSYVLDGVVRYSSQRPQGLANIGPVRTLKYAYMETCYACSVRPGVDFGTVSLNTQAYRAEIAAAALDFGVEEAVVRAIIHAESAYNPNALSRVGAQGLMQLMPATARRFGVANVFDIRQNIRGGVQYLAWLLKRFDGNLVLAAAGYNAGEGAVDKYKGVPPYSETQRYVQRVAQLAERYRDATVAR
ncbi:lytic transglycosylase domain-containing protein [Lysobacter cavernae]|uniref:Lytic transglycosylase domain-containing protein n=1 Tax=Lysobacter cavernae TaxID=1685901 RepID=A0ABV7RMZ2_9GAMM